MQLFRLINSSGTRAAGVCVAIALAACDDPTGIPGAQLRITPDSITLTSIGGTAPLSAELRRADGTSVDGVVRWRSLATDIATINAAGTVTGVRAGTAIVEAEAEGARAQAVVVVQQAAASIQIDSYPATVSAGDTLKLRATVRDARGNVIPEHKVLWRSWSSEFVTVDSTGAVVVGMGGDIVIVAYANDVVRDTARFVSLVRYDDVVTAGGAHSCGVTLQGQTYCWGSPPWTLGWGTSGCCDEPVLAHLSGEVPIRFRQISAGSRHTCGVDVNNVGYCWGSAFQSGTRALEALHVTPMDSAPFFRSISAGEGHSCGVSPDGDAYCWGNGRRGEIGRVALHQQLPIRVVTAIKFTAIDAGGRHTCAIGTDQHAYCWGVNDFGQLGIGSSDTLPHAAPTRVQGNHRFVAISAGGQHTCAIDEQNNLYCWGNNHVAQLTGGNSSDACPVTGGTWACATTPVRISLPAPAANVSAGYDHNCALTTGNALFCWGNNANGKTGVESSLITASPAQMTGMWTAVAAGRDHTCGVRQQLMVCWGDNTNSQLGTGAQGGMFARPVTVLYQQ